MKRTREEEANNHQTKNAKHEDEKELVKGIEAEVEKVVGGFPIALTYDDVLLVPKLSQ